MHLADGTRTLGRPYGPSFWWTYLANLSLMVAVSLLFRYADFITQLGGTEKQLGLITGVGMLGAIASRCLQGVAIDHYTPARVWKLSLLLLIVCLAAHLSVTTLRPPWIHLLRVLYTVSLAGAFGASITFISLLAPPSRIGEMIGMLGSSGFIGMAIGPLLGDAIFAQAGSTGAVQIFVWAAGAGTVSLACASIATRGPVVRPLTHDPLYKSTIRSAFSCVGKYHPGFTLIVGIAMGIGIGMPGTFLKTFADEKAIVGLRHFFVVYAVVAFTARIATRRLTDQWGTRPMIVVGLGSLATSYLAYMAVSSDWTLVFPALLGGIGHALLFPAAVSETIHAFPEKHRGLATTLILMMFDVGMLVGQPVVGFTVEIVRARGGDGYFAAFSGLAVLLAVVAAIHTRAVGNESLTPDAAQD